MTEKVSRLVLVSQDTLQALRELEVGFTGQCRRHSDSELLRSHWR